MSTFIVVAALMVVGALALVLVPLLRRSGDQARAGVSAVLVVMTLPLLAGWLYTRWSNWPWKGTPATAQQDVPPDVAAMVERLSQRLARDGGSLEDWQMLGRSRIELRQYDLAAEAYRQAYRMSGGSDLETLTSYAEALALSDPGALRADAGDLFERALTLAPQDIKSLWYGGLTAYSREQYGLARDRWRAMIDRDPQPPDDVRQVIEERIAAAESHLNGSAEPSAAATGQPRTPTETGASGASGRTIVVDVSLSPALATQLDPDAPLFVLARAPGAGGPPLAVERRQASELPLTIELSDADAMVPGRNLSSAAQVEIVARVALGGQPMATTGDLYGSVEVADAATTHAHIEIDRVQP